MSCCLRITWIQTYFSFVSFCFIVITSSTFRTCCLECWMRAMDKNYRDIIPEPNRIESVGVRTLPKQKLKNWHRQNKRTNKRKSSNAFVVSRSLANSNKNNYVTNEKFANTIIFGCNHNRRACAQHTDVDTTRHWPRRDAWGNGRPERR